jgi:hypothetical protein
MAETRVGCECVCGRMTYFRGHGRALSVLCSFLGRHDVPITRGAVQPKMLMAIAF